MTNTSQFPGLDGLMLLSRREGVDIRPTLLRVLTDLYVQTERHTDEEQRQFIELALRLFDEVDDATRAMVRAKLTVYRGTPFEIAVHFGIIPLPDPEVVLPEAPQYESAPYPAKSTTLNLQPAEAYEISAIFWRATPSERAQILHELEHAPLRPAAPIQESRRKRGVEALEQAALARDIDRFIEELSTAMILPIATAQQIVNDPAGEPLACAAKALAMPSDAFQRVLLFLTPQISDSVTSVYRLSRLYDNLSERAAMIMLAAWRGTTIATHRAKYRSAFHDSERNRARTSSQGVQPVQEPITRSTPSRGSGQS